MSRSMHFSSDGTDFEDFDSSHPPSQTSHVLFDPLITSYLDAAFSPDHGASAAVWPRTLHRPPLPSQPAPRIAKKRPRASRRTPTTVLTTDISNFRAMVQEFTGISAPSFINSPCFSRPRLHALLGNSSNINCAIASPSLPPSTPLQLQPKHRQLVSQWPTSDGDLGSAVAGSSAENQPAEGLRKAAAEGEGGLEFW